jgi:hypothetical protein
MKNQQASNTKFIGMIAYPGLQVTLMPPTGQFANWLADGVSRLLSRVI